MERTNVVAGCSAGVFLISTAATGPLAQSIDVPAALPDSVYDFVETAAARCNADETAHFAQDGFTRQYDFNSDGVHDYIVNSDYFRCLPDSYLIYGGTAGTHYAFFISQPDGTFDKAMHLTAHRMETVFSTENPTFVFAHHGTACGYSGSTGCVSAFFWSNSENRFIGKGYNWSDVRQDCAPHPMSIFDPETYPRTLEQAPIFGVGVHILIGVDHQGRYTVFDQEGARLFGPVVFGEVAPGHPSLEPHLLRIHLRPDADAEEREQLWCRDLMMMAGHFHKQRLTAHLQDIDLHGPSLAPLIGRIGKQDEHIIKALGLWAKRVELVEDVRALGAMLPKGTVGLIGNGAYAYAMAGMCAYDVEVPVTDLEPHGAEKTLGVGYEKLRLLPEKRWGWKRKNRG